MTQYRVMAKAKHGKRFQCYGHHTDPKFAERHAETLARDLWTGEVKIIVKDDNGITNEVTYKTLERAMEEDSRRMARFLGKALLPRRS